LVIIEVDKNTEGFFKSLLGLVGNYYRGTVIWTYYLHLEYSEFINKEQLKHDFNIPLFSICW